MAVNLSHKHGWVITSTIILCTWLPMPQYLITYWRQVYQFLAKLKNCIYICVYIFSPCDCYWYIYICIVKHIVMFLTVLCCAVINGDISWWRHQMETFSALLAICAGNSQRPVTRSFDVFFDLRLNKRLSKQSWGWWFETLSSPLCWHIFPWFCVWDVCYITFCY